MATINFIIPDAKITKVITAMKGLYAIPNDKDGVPLFTDAAWAKECVRRWIIAQVARYEQSEAIKIIAYSPDDGLAS